MNEGSDLLTRLKGSRQVNLRHVKNMERIILDEIGTFSCKNEEQIAKLIGLKNGLLEKINKVKEIEIKKYLTFYHMKSREKARRHFGVRRFIF